jgi:hypothetical protein
VHLCLNICCAAQPSEATEVTYAKVDCEEGIHEDGAVSTSASDSPTPASAAPSTAPSPPPEAPSPEPARADVGKGHIKGTAKRSQHLPKPRGRTLALPAAIGKLPTLGPGKAWRDRRAAAINPWFRETR